MAELPKGKRSSGLGRPQSGESWAWTVHCEAEAGPVQAFARQEAGPGEADRRSSPGPEEVAQRRDRGWASRGQWQAGGAGPGEADLRKSGSWRGRGEAGAGPAEADWATSTACRGRREQERALERPSRGQRGPAEAAGRRSWAWRGWLEEVCGMETPGEGRSWAWRGHRGDTLQDVWGLQRPRSGSWAGGTSKQVVERPELGLRPQPGK